jgi:hypothetical protein
MSVADTPAKVVVIDWKKPKKARPQAEHNRYSFNDGPPGGYIPNMSDEAKARWKGKKIGGKNPRVEIRKTGCQGNQMLIIVSPTNGVRISMNGPIVLNFPDWADMQAAISEAREVLALNKELF